MGEIISNSGLIRLIYTLLAVINIFSGIVALWAVKAFKDPDFLAREFVPKKRRIIYVYSVAIFWSLIVFIESFMEEIFVLKIVEVLISLLWLALILIWLSRLKVGIGVNIYPFPSGFARILIGIATYWLFALELETYAEIPILLIKRIIAFGAFLFLIYGFYFVHIHKLYSMHILFGKNLTKVLTTVILGFLMMGFGFANEIYGFEVTYSLMEILGIFSLVYASYVYTKLLRYGEEGI